MGTQMAREAAPSLASRKRIHATVSMDAMIRRELACCRCPGIQAFVLSGYIFHLAKLISVSTAHLHAVM
jgi:hypothetical protein